MFLARRTALRFLSAPSCPSVVKARSVSSFSISSVRRSSPSLSSRFQKRWVTGESDSKEQEVPVSQLQPTAQDEVENAISQDNAAAEISASFSQPPSETTATGSPVEEVVADAVEQESAVDTSEAAVTDAVSGTSGVTGAATTQASKSPSQLQPNTPKPTIYIGNLFFDVTENDLVKELARFGSIKRARLIRDARGLSKGFGYVEFENVDSAQKAIDTLNQQLFEGRRLNVQFANLEFHPGPRDPSTHKPMNPPTKTLFIGNMSFEMTDRDLNNLFRGIRNVVDVRVAIDRRTGQPRGFAHADFIDVKSAMEAMKVLKDKETYGRRLRVDYSYGPSTAPRNLPQNE